MKKTAKIDFKGLFLRYKATLVNRPLYVMSCVLMFIFGYFTVIFKDALPKGFGFIPTAGAFVFAAGFCTCFIIIIKPILGFILLPVIEIILKTLKTFIDKIAQPINSIPDGIKKDETWND